MAVDSGFLAFYIDDPMIVFTAVYHKVSPVINISLQLLEKALE
jgi:hypothetical protein